MALEARASFGPLPRPSLPVVRQRIPADFATVGRETSEAESEDVKSRTCATCSAARRASVMHAAPRTSGVLSSHLDTAASAKLVLLLVNATRGQRSHQASRILQCPHHCWTSFLGHRQLAQDLQGLSDARMHLVGASAFRSLPIPMPPKQTVGSLHWILGFRRLRKADKTTYGLLCARVVHTATAGPPGVQQVQKFQVVQVGLEPFTGRGGCKRCYH